MRVCGSLRALQRMHATVRDSMLPLPSRPAEAVALNHLQAWHQVKHAEGHAEANLANSSDRKNVQQWVSQSTSHLDLPGGTVGEGPSANAGGTASIPGLGRFHMPQGKGA